MAYVSLSKMPTPKKEYVVNFPKLAGGLNIQELDYRIDNDESPEMKNLLWREGILSSRDGQVWVNSSELDDFVTAYDRKWNGKFFMHANRGIYMVDPETGEREQLYVGGEDMTVRGKFFAYHEELYYKTVGYYVVIKYVNEVFTASDVDAYTPVTYINCSPYNGSGTVYQPENRLSAKKELWYNATYKIVAEADEGISVSVEDSSFRIRAKVPGVYTFQYDSGVWTLNGVVVDILDYGISVGGLPLINTAGVQKTVVVNYYLIPTYYLPVRDVDLVSIKVDGVEQVEEEISYSISDTVNLSMEFDLVKWRGKVGESGTYVFTYNYDALPVETWELDGAAVDPADYGITVEGRPITGDTVTVEYARGNYWLDEEAGTINFFTPPPVYYPEVNNTVRIIYSKDNEVAYNNIMDCRYAEVYGGTGGFCIVMAGSKTQPNAYFWNGQNSIAMDPSYFPMTQYQLASEATDPITGFGKQQGFLIIFKEGSLGRTSVDMTMVEERTTIDMPYTPINAKIGCDLPYTIQLIENNLTWCNTQSGVHFLANTSSAYENNVICISEKVNESGQKWTSGLLAQVRDGDRDKIVSHDDDKHYWLVVNGSVWLWDYTISNYKTPAWFYLDGINGRAFMQENDDIWHFDEKSRLTMFRRCYYDYDPDEKGNGGIPKVFRFATQFFGTYDNLKNINSVIINTRSDTTTVMDLTYETDYEERKDLTPLSTEAWRLVPRDLSFRNLAGSGFAKVFRRKPHCRRVHYFTMRLENDRPLHDMAVVSAQIYYVFEGRYR